MMKNNNKGVAMIVAVVMALVFFMLVLTVSVLSTSAYKRSHFYKDRAIALNLAEAGIADALYRMNYKDYGAGAGHLYPWGDGAADNPDTVNDPFGTGSGSYIIELTDAGANADILKATGIYKGRRRTIQVKIRGDNAIGDDLNKVDNGIAEAFNKHVVYAKTVTLGATPTTITGNVITESADPGTVVGRTWTQMAANALGAVPAPPDINSDITADPGNEAGFVAAGGTWYKNGWLQGDEVTSFNASGYGAYVDATDTYNFDAATKTIANSLYIVQGTIGANGPGGPGSVLAENGHANFTNTTTFSNFFKAAGQITVSNTVTVNANGALKGLGGITVNGATITGSLAVRDSDLSFSTAASTIDSSGNTKKGAVMLYDALGNNSLTIDANFAPNITLKNDDSQAAIIVYSTVAITAAEPVAINDAPQINLASGNQPAGIIVYSTSDNANLTINTPADTINGLIYAGSGDATATYSATITLTDGTVGSSTLGGVIVAGGTDPANTAGGTINLNGGTINWKKRNYVATSSIFQNFSGGRRVYLPVIGSWKEE